MPGPTGKRAHRQKYRQQLTEEKSAKLPSKKFFRQRAHANPFADHRLEYPLSPDHMDWAAHFPSFIDPDVQKTNLAGSRRLVKNVEIADIGCGFGGLLMALSPLMPDTLMVGMEIRSQVLEYVTSKIHALRSRQPVPSVPRELKPKEDNNNNDDGIQEENNSPAPSSSSSSKPSYQNISALRANTMKFLPNFFSRHQLSKIFICFPDPHFKARKHKARIVSPTLNAEYAFVLRPGGKVYTITDVEDLHKWMVAHFEGKAVEGEERVESGNGSGICDLWERISDEELAGDECVRVMRDETEEGKKVTRNGGQKFIAVWRRKKDPEWS